MAKTENEKRIAQRAYAKKHTEEKLDTIIIRPHKGIKEMAKEKAKKEGKSLSRFIIDLIVMYNS